jgi:hypothetical protein
VKRNPGEGEIYGLKFIIDDGTTVEVVTVNNLSMKELEERIINVSLTDISNASNITKVSVAPIFKLKSGKEVTGDVKDEYLVPKSSVGSGRGTSCTPATCSSLGKNCGSWANGTCAGTLTCGSYGGGCQTGYACQTNGTCIKSTTETWSDELMINGGFELGNLTGWTNSGINWAVGIHPSNIYSNSGAMTPQAGSYCAYYSAGPSSVNYYIYQDVNLINYATSIDSGTALINASGWGVSAEYDCDNTGIQIIFLNSAKQIISTPVDTGYNWSQYWWKVGISNYPIPANTRYVRIWANTYESCCDSGSLDSFSVKVKAGLCANTCASLGYECGTHIICGNNIICGSYGGGCQTGYACQTNGTCIKSATETCSDGIQNNGETEIDCGGPCIDCVEQADYYVAPNGNDNNPGTITQPWRTWKKAFSTAQAGDLVYFRGGVYPYSDIGADGIEPNSGTADNWIRFFNYPGEEPILDCDTLITASAEYQRAIGLWEKSYIHFKGLTVRNVHMLDYPGSSMGNDHAIAEGIILYYSEHITFENMKLYNIEGVALGIYGSDEIRVKNCDAWNTVDWYQPDPGQNGIGFHFKTDPIFFTPKRTDSYLHNTHSYFEGCRTWNFSDNGFAATGVGYVEFKNCWAFDGGVLTGDGFGWKNGVFGEGHQDLVNPLSKLITNCISANNGYTGFSPNNNDGSSFNAHYYNNFAYHNGYKHYLLWWQDIYGNGFCITNTIDTAPNEMYSNNIAYDNEHADVWALKDYIHQ